MGANSKPENNTMRVDSKLKKFIKVLGAILTIVMIISSGVTIYNTLKPNPVKIDVHINPSEVTKSAEDSQTPVLYNVAYDYSSRTVSGNIGGVENATDYKLILFILTDQWYVKPDFDRYTHKGLSDLQNNERFLLDAYTFGRTKADDIKATKYTVFLVPSSYSGLEHPNDYDGANAASVYSYMDVIKH